VPFYEYATIERNKRAFIQYYWLAGDWGRTRLSGSLYWKRWERWR